MLDRTEFLLLDVLENEVVDLVAELEHVGPRLCCREFELVVLSVEGGDEFDGLREGDMEVVRGIYLLPVAIDYERVLAEQAVFHNFITLIYWMQAVTHCLKRSREQYSLDCPD